MTEYIESNLQMQSSLILFIETNHFNNIKMYVGWSESEQLYYVRGNNEENNIPFGFNINSFDTLHTFITHYYKNDVLRLNVYNYNNIMYWDTSELTYDFFESYRDKQYLMYNMFNLGIEKLSPLLSLVRYCYNKQQSINN